MPKENLIRINPDGSILFLYSDELGSMDFGKIKCRRASDVTWDEEKQRWRIDYHVPGLQCDKYFQTRQEAIDYELVQLEIALAENPVEMDAFVETSP